MTHKDLLEIIDNLDITDNSEAAFEIEAQTVDGNFVGETTTDNTDYLEQWSHEVIDKCKEAIFILTLR